MKITKWRMVKMPSKDYIIEEAIWHEGITEFVWTEVAKFRNYDDANNYTFQYPKILKYN